MKTRTRLLTVALFSLLAGPLSASAAGAQKAESLDAVLEKARAYCRRLDRAALDFVCREEVTEKINGLGRPVGITIQNMPTNVTNNPGALHVQAPPPESFVTTTYLYDYQYVRKVSDVRERRDLIKKDGEDIQEADTRVKTLHFKFAEVFFGPSVLLGANASAGHIYKLAKTDKVEGQPVAVINCGPRGIGGERPLSGKAWVRIADGAVLKIEWDPETFGSYREVLEVAKKFKMKPKIKSGTEFGVERNGLRFPSLDVTEEVYSGGGSSIFTRAIITAKYKDYKFFTVETETDIRRP
ncbi:MAG: hypothetical protein PHI34_09190 [Acidobacteriota bacterium]|nr:hypothetical protein [Acidobacteriota bacterium]